MVSDNLNYWNKITLTSRVFRPKMLIEKHAV